MGGTAPIETSDLKIPVVEKKPEPPRPTKYAWIVLGLVLFIYICNQWHRSGKHLHSLMSSSILALAYATGYTSRKGPYYRISEAIPRWTENYKFLSGAAFTIPISIVGIFMVRGKI